MTKNLIPTIDISSLVNQDFNSNKSIETINKIKKMIKKIYLKGFSVAMD